MVLKPQKRRAFPGSRGGPPLAWGRPPKEVPAEEIYVEEQGTYNWVIALPISQL